MELEDKNKNKFELYEENVEIISSDHSGVGKSTQIKLKIKSKNKKYIYFHLGDDCYKEEVINRLKKLGNLIKEEEKTVLHLDLSFSKQTELMKEFLFCFLFTKYFGQNKNLFYLPKKNRNNH